MSKDTTAGVAPAFFALGCVGFIASAIPAAAQTSTAPSDAAPGTRLGGVTVTDTAINDTGYKVERPEGPKATAPLLNTPRSVVVIDKQVIKDTGSATLVEALRTVPGITFGAAEGGNPIGDRPFIRGYDSQGSTFLDGVRDIGAQSREVFDIEQIQVVRGSDSTLAGRGSAGGSINIISKLPTDETFIAGSGSYGTADYKRVTGDINYKLGDMVAFRINGMWHDQDVAGRDAIFQKRWGIAPAVTIGVGGPTQLTASYYHLHTNELPDSGIPYLYTVGNAPGTGTIYSQPAESYTTISGKPVNVDRDTFYGLKNRDFRKSNTDQAMLRFDHDFGNGLKIRNTARYSHTYQAYILTQPDDSQGNVYATGNVWRRANTRYGYTDSLINQTDLYGDFNTGSVKHRFSVGSEFSTEKTRRGAFVLATGSGISPRCNTTTIARFYCTTADTPNPNDNFVNYTSDTSNVATPITKGGPRTETRNDATTKAAYAFDSITLTDQLILNLGARFDSFKTKVTAPLTVGGAQISKKNDLFNWQASGIFKPTASTSLYATYATSATPPNSLLAEGQDTNGLSAPSATVTAATAQALSDALKVEKTKSYEVGGKADLFDGALSLNVAVFQTKTANARVTSDQNTIAFVGKRRVRGVEFGFNGNITPQLKVFGGYTYLDAKIVDGGSTALAVAANGPARATTVQVNSVNTGRQFPQTAKHSATIWADWTPIEKLSLGGGAFYTSRVFGGYQDNRTASQTAAGVITVVPASKQLVRTVPGYVRFDARAGYKLTDQVDLSVNVQNLTNKRYYNQAYSSHYASIAPGRSAFATVSFKY